MNGADVVAAARSQLGVPYQHQARLWNVAVDCIGLVVAVGLYLGLPEAKAFAADPRFKGYGKPPNPRLLLLGCDTYLDRIQVHTTLPGDIVLGRIEKEPQHFGIVSAIDPPYLIHAYTQVGRVTENRADENWKSKVLRAYRYRGLE